jgi:sortase A
VKKISPSKISFGFSFVIVGVVFVACFSLVVALLNSDLLGKVSYAKEVSISKVEELRGQEVEKREVNPIGLPVRIIIPKISVNAKLEHVGLTAQGAVGVPKGPVSAAWYNLSSHPGDIGSAIITGHYGRWKSGVFTVFNQLNKLKKGDKVLIEDEKGVSITFIVRELRIYALTEEVSQVFSANDTKAHLNLITCAGIWNPLLKSYPKRLVVFTERE